MNYQPGVVDRLMSMNGEPARAKDLHEWVDLSEATLDPQSYTVKGARLIKAGWSLNERYYGDEVLAKAAPIWEGAKAYADHPSKSDLKDRPERSIRDLVGYYTQPVHEGGRTKADFRVLGEARTWLWPLIQETIDTGVPVVGLSINALGSVRKGEAEGKKGLIVEAITHGNSVDVVTTPAAGGGFTLLTASDDGWTRAVLGAMTLEELREARPDLLDSLKREWKTTRDSEAIREAHAEAENARQEAARLSGEHRTTQAALNEAQAELAALKHERTVDRLLASKKLPDEVREELRDKLLKADSIEAMTEVLDTTMKVLGAVRLPVRVTGAGRVARQTAPQQAVRPSNAIAEVFGIDPALANAQTIDQFLEARSKH
jgi:hypothetical protein